MDCLSDELILDFLGDELTHERYEAAACHFVLCTRCEERREELQDIVEGIATAFRNQECIAYDNDNISPSRRW